MMPDLRKPPLAMAPDELQATANAMGRGYLKHWKAASMLSTLRDIPGIAGDVERLRKWVENCLEMEGFSAAGIDTVTQALHERCKSDW